MHRVLTKTELSDTIKLLESYRSRSSEIRKMAQTYYGKYRFPNSEADFHNEYDDYVDALNHCLAFMLKAKYFNSDSGLSNFIASLKSIRDGRRDACMPFGEVMYCILHHINFFEFILSRYNSMYIRNLE